MSPVFDYKKSKALRDSGWLAAMRGTPFMVFWILSTYSDEDGLAYPAMATIGKQLGIDRRNILKAIDELVEIRAIERVGKRVTKSGKVNVYRIILDPSTPPLETKTSTTPLVDENVRKVGGLVDENVTTLVDENVPRTTPDKHPHINIPNSDSLFAYQKTELSKPKTKTGKANPFSEIPANIDTPAMRAALENWWQYLKEKKKAPSPSTVKAQLAKLAKMGETAAIQSIQQSIENGWQGLFEPKKGNAYGKPNNDYDPETQHRKLAGEHLEPKRHCPEL